jgi:hypothetical protein
MLESALATKEDIRRLEARLDGFATKEDIRRLEARLDGFATREDVQNLLIDLHRLESATKADIQRLESAIETLGQRLTIRLGGMLVVAVGALAAMRFFG